MKVVFKEDLDEAMKHGCQKPGCNHEGHDTLYLHSRCHPQARAEVSYTVGSGHLVVACAHCKTPIVIASLANRPPDMPQETPPEDDYSTVACLRVDLYDCGDRAPRDILSPIYPDNLKRRAWIPQTLGDQIWVLYDFNSVEERVAWEEKLPDQVRKWLDRNLIPHAVTFGWEVRDFNGFVV